MGDTESILCPTCGWTGARGDLDESGGERQCPACEEGIDFAE